MFSNASSDGGSESQREEQLGKDLEAILQVGGASCWPST